ncbi:MAG: hypothetical protein ACOX5G_12425 [Kiritimatiellia bacterium]|jgi:hypothetical protein
MTPDEIRSKVSGVLAVAADGAHASCVYTGDLLSDVMAHAGEGCALVTVQNHLNTIAVCTLVGCSVIVVCHDRPIPPDMAEAAAREGVAIVTTPLSQYAASLALSGLPPC